MEQWNRVLGILDCVKRRDRFRFHRNPDRTPARAALSDERGVLFLNVGRIAQHGPAKVYRCGRRVYGTTETVLDQRRQVAAVVEVSVREHHAVDGTARKRETTVAVTSFLAAALVEAAIEQEAVVVHPDFVHASRDIANSTPKGKFHDLFRIPCVGAA
jgi:hypothetical protein